MPYYPRPKRRNPPFTLKLLAERSTINPETGCMIWNGNKSADGYGEYYFCGKTLRVHREAYRFVNGDFDDRLIVCHRCDNPSCANPDHLFLGTNRDNTNDMLAKGRSAKGERHGNSRLTSESVLAIRKMREEEGKSFRDIGVAFGICKEAARQVCARKRWGHVP